MKKDKRFDCVQMKWAIQKEIDAELAGMSDKEAHRILAERVTQNPILGQFLKKVDLAKKSKMQKKAHL